MNGASTIRAVIFDMDGVLTDSEPLINEAASAMFRERGLTVQAEDFRPFVGAGEDRYLGGVAEKYGFPLDLAAAKKRTYEIYLERVPARLRAFPGAIELVQDCKRAGLKVALASSADRVKIDANLNQIGLPPVFWDASVSAEDVTRKKPAPDIFLVTAQKLGLAPDQCAVVEDAVNGVQAANAAGMRCVAVAHTFPAEELRLADLVKPSIANLQLADLAPGESGGGVGREPLHGAPPANASAAAAEMAPAGDPDRSQAKGGTGRDAPRAGPWGPWATLGFGLEIAAAFVAAQFVVGLGFSFVAMATGHEQILLDGQRLQTNGLFQALTTCGAAPVGIGMTCLAARWRRGVPVGDYLGLKKVPGRALLLWCVSFLAISMGSDGLSLLLGRPVVPAVVVESYKTAGFLPLFWLAVVVLAPLNEEVFFRGFLFAGLSRSRLGGVGATLLTSGLWAVIHGQYDWYGRATIFAFGLLLGGARLKTNSIVPTILMHALMNLATTLEVEGLIRFSGGGPN
jgi:HAD superfamily hydrolase (TIGR01509 family)